MTFPASCAFDPELSAVTQFPVLDSTDIATRRAQLAAILTQLPVPDATGLTVTD